MRVYLWGPCLKLSLYKLAFVQVSWFFSEPVIIFEIGYYDTSNIVLLMVILTIKNLLHFHVKFEIFFPSSVKLSLGF